MKKFFSILVALAALVTFQSCVEDETDDTFTAKVVTLDVTDVTEDGCAFHATIEYKGGAACAPTGGIYFGKTSDLSHEAGSFTTNTIMLSNGSNKIDEYVKATPAHYPAPGGKLYYRAYARVHTPGGNEQFVFGETKSVTIPETK